MEHFLTLKELNERKILELIELGIDVKANRKRYEDSLKNKTLAMIFLKPSTRTRCSFEIAMNQMSGYAMFLKPEDLQLKRDETLRETGAVLSEYADFICARVFEHSQLEELAEKSKVPVINALSNSFHPCQIMADLMTLKEVKGKLEGLNLTFLGDIKNNIINSFLAAATKVGISLTLSGPEEIEPVKELVEFAEKESQHEATVSVERDAVKAVAEADAIYTDVWFSMHEKETEEKLKAFQPYQVNSKLLEHAKENALVMHCMPVHINQEMTEDVMYGKNSVLLRQAANRLFIQKAILLHLDRQMKK